MASTLSLSPLFRTKLAFPRRSSNLNSITSESRCATTTPSRFSWNDVLQLSESNADSYSLQGYFDRIKSCNRGSERKSEFLPFVVEQQTVGHVHKQFAGHLKKFNDVFRFADGTLFDSQSTGYVTLHQSLASPEDRTEAVGAVIKFLGEGFFPGIRNELFPVTSAYGMPAYFLLERAAAPYFGIKVYGVNVNGYVNKGGQKLLWIGKRSESKPINPGMLDHLVAGALPHNITCKENVLKECEEEAGIPMSISNAAIPVGAFSYRDIEGYKYRRHFAFCYDLELPGDFIPRNQDGEVESFELIPVKHVANIIRRTEFFRATSSLVIIDFLFRHGFISPDERGYLQLLQSLRSEDCT